MKYDRNACYEELMSLGASDLPEHKEIRKYTQAFLQSFTIHWTCLEGLTLAHFHENLRVAVYVLPPEDTQEINFSIVFNNNPECYSVEEFLLSVAKKLVRLDIDYVSKSLWDIMYMRTLEKYLKIAPESPLHALSRYSYENTSDFFLHVYANQMPAEIRDPLETSYNLWRTCHIAEVFKEMSTLVLHT